MAELFEHASRRMVDKEAEVVASALGIAGDEQGAPATCVGVVLFQFVKSFTMNRTKTNVNPPAPVPQISGADT